MPHYPAAAPPQFSLGDRAREASIIAVRAAWSQAPTLISLLAVLSYGLGRLTVDGFYAQLNTTAEAAGLGYSAILEPAAILTASMAAIGTVIVMLMDVIEVIGVWIFRQRTRMLWLAGFASLAAGSAAAIIAGIARADLVIDAIISSAGSLPALRTLVDKFGSARDRRIGEARARDDRSLEYSVSARRPIAKRSVSVILSLVFLISLFFGAHELGSHEGRQVANGKPVHMSVFGFDVPSITAIAVYIKPTGSSSVLKQLAKNRCWLQNRL